MTALDELAANWETNARAALLKLSADEIAALHFMFLRDERHAPLLAWRAAQEVEKMR